MATLTEMLEEAQKQPLFVVAFKCNDCDGLHLDVLSGVEELAVHLCELLASGIYHVSVSRANEMVGVTSEELVKIAKEAGVVLPAEPSDVPDGTVGRMH